MDRVIPNNLEKSILGPLLGHENRTEAKYRKEIEAFEKKCEESLINTLGRLDVHATVKSDRYSLPYQKEVIVQLGGESYMNGPYEFYRVARKFVKELLNENVYKIRFYILVDVDTEFGMMGKVVYKFRYYIH
jgi:hypothetical protein